ncbi:unnamed protein product [Calypogeia fissa]
MTALTHSLTRIPSTKQQHALPEDPNNQRANITCKGKASHMITPTSKRTLIPPSNPTMEETKDGRNIRQQRRSIDTHSHYIPIRGIAFQRKNNVANREDAGWIVNEAQTNSALSSTRRLELKEGRREGRGGIRRKQGRKHSTANFVTRITTSSHA